MPAPQEAHVLLAPDKFKGSLTGPQVAQALARGLARVRPGLPVRLVPVADGGDGTVDAALAAGYQRMTVTVTGPTGSPVEAVFAVRDGLAVLETAAACGLALLPGGITAPLIASSHGAGELVLAALDAGCHTVVLGVGGSASTDGGAGLLAALGATLTDAAGRPLPAGGAALGDLAAVDLSTLDDRLDDVTVVLASDVDNPLLGPAGAAAVFGPQKGATPAQVDVLEQGLRRWAVRLDEAVGGDYAGAPGAGAAGGIGFAALAGLGARRRSGIELLLDLIGFPAALAGARLVITGEGSLDEQTLHGKAPIGVVRAAAAAGVPAIAVAGRCLLDPSRLTEAGIAAAYPLTDLEPDPARCIAEADRLLAGLADRIAADWLKEQA